MTQQNNNKSIMERIMAPTPSFFRKIRNIGLTMGAVGAALLSAPITLPAVFVSVAGYMATAGLVATAISQAVYKEDH